MGRQHRRADQTTCRLDRKYHVLLPWTARHRLAHRRQPVDVLLRSAAGYHAYPPPPFRRRPRRRRWPGSCCFNRRFPRSVYLCIQQTESLLSELKSRYALRNGNEAAEALDGLRALLGALSIEEILQRGLHEFLDLVQLRLIALSRHLSHAFFGKPQIVPAQTDQTG